MGRWPPRPPRSKFIREGADYCDGCVREAIYRYICTNTLGR